MGVLYESADDVAELLVPYVREHGSPLTTADIEETYRSRLHRDPLRPGRHLVRPAHRCAGPMNLTVYEL
jgi:hypothetical protein